MSTAADRLALRKALFLCMSYLDSNRHLEFALQTYDLRSSQTIKIEKINNLAMVWRQQTIFRIEISPEDIRIQELWIDHPTIDRPVLIAMKAMNDLNPLGLSEYGRLEAIANLSAWIELTAGQTAELPIKPVERDKITEARDKWIYDECCKLTPYLAIVNRLKKKTKWEQIDTEQGIIDAAKRYANRHGVEPPPSRRNK